MPRPIPSPDWYKQCIDDLMGSVPPPQAVDHDGISDFRFREQTIQQAILLKAVKYVSGLNAGDVLLKQGFLHELGILRRTLHEVKTDVMFLAKAISSDEYTEGHKRFLKNFWNELHTLEELNSPSTNKNNVQQRDIRDYIIGESPGEDTERIEETLKHLTHLYSGFIHGASAHIMDIYNHKTTKFDLSGIRNRSIRRDYEYDWEDCHFMGAILMLDAASALRKDQVCQRAIAMLEELTPHYIKNAPQFPARRL
ncbi:MAG: hypothetical protein ACRBBK_09885 [Paracoccaceae bacterium]